MIHRLVLIWIILAATCLSALGDENATNSSITITEISPQIDSTLKGKTTDFSINVDYDLNDSDYGKILLSVDEFTTGSADQVYTISQGDQIKGSHIFKINKLLGKNWKNAYVSATLYAAKKDSPLPAEYSAFDYRQFPVEADPNKSVTIDTCSLPSTQGWTYSNLANSLSEADTFSIQKSGQDCILHQNTIGIGFQNQGSNGYTLSNVVDPAKPFVLKVKARVTNEEQANDYNHWGFCFQVDNGAESFGIGISPQIIAALDNEISSKVLNTSIDNTKYHDYRLEGTPGVGYNFYVDDILAGSGLPKSQGDLPSWEGINRLYLGDGTGGCNAIADVAGFEFAQPASCYIDGNWSWFSGQTVVIHNNGTLDAWTGSLLDDTGSWMQINATRKLYVIQWNLYPNQSEGYVDTLELSDDCMKLEGYSLLGTHVIGKRMT